MLSSEEAPLLDRALSKARNSVILDEEMDRIPPSSDDLFENLPWLNIMADIALTAAISEIKVK